MRPLDERQTAAMDVVAGEILKVARRPQIDVEVACGRPAAWLESAPRRLVDEQRADAETTAFNQPLDDQPPFAHEQTVCAQQLGIGDIPVRRDPGIVRPGNTHHWHRADQITRACRMTASDFRRISLATSKGSPSWNFGRNNSTERGPAYPFSESFRRIFTSGVTPSPGITRVACPSSSRGMSGTSWKCTCAISPGWSPSRSSNLLCPDQK